MRLVHDIGAEISAEDITLMKEKDDAYHRILVPLVEETVTQWQVQGDWEDMLFDHPVLKERYWNQREEYSELRMRFHYLLQAHPNVVSQFPANGKRYKCLQCRWVPEAEKTQMGWRSNEFAGYDAAAASFLSRIFSGASEYRKLSQEESLDCDEVWWAGLNHASSYTREEKNMTEKPKNGKKRSKEEVKESILLYFDKQYSKREQRLSALYNDSYLNQAGTLADAEDTFTTEYVSELLEDHISDLLEIPPVPDAGKEYDRSKANQKTLGGGLKGCYPENCGSTRKEEYIAKYMNQKPYAGIGLIKGIQVPLKQVQEDAAGKIDMLGYDENKQLVSILELKKPDSSETMLRCVMEAFTYFKQLNRDNLLKDFSIQKPVTFAISPLVYKESRACKELTDDKEAHVSLRQFMCALNKALGAEAEIRPLCYDVNADKTDYVVEEITGWEA